MKKLSLILLVYNFIGLCLLYGNWIYEVVTIDLSVFNFWSFDFGIHTTERLNVFDFFDTPFYVLWFLLLLKYAYFKFKTLSNLDIFCNFGCLVYLLLKFANLKFQFFNFESFMFWNFFIIGFTFFSYLIVYGIKKRNV